ncbi:MAG: DUF4365 domain-containing protein [Cyanobacteria bacterium SBLK]|nr:DUF4365 domain-containing protein [Cyanobacteria bacterium SBLK]
MPRKQRPREHIIADLSINHVERYAFLCGYSVERVTQDYGYDLIIFTYNAYGEIENGHIYVQLKATDNLKVLSDGQTITFVVKRADLELWLDELMPCILIIYDAREECAYWLYLQAYFENLSDFDLAKIGETFTLRIPKTNIVNQKSMREFAKYRTNLLNQVQGRVRFNV